MKKSTKLYLYKRNRIELYFTRELSDFEVLSNGLTMAKEDEHGRNKPFIVNLSPAEVMELMDKGNRDKLQKWALSVFKQGSDRVEQK